MTDVFAHFATIFCEHCGQPTASNGRYCSGCGALRHPATPSSAPTGHADRALSWVAVAAGAGLAIGSFLPWVKVTAPFVGTLTKSGMEGGDGLITLALGIAAVIVGLLAVNRTKSTGLRVWLFLLGAAGIAMAGLEAADLSRHFADIKAGTDLVVANYGAGLWLIGIAGITLAAVALFDLRPLTAKPTK